MFDFVVMPEGISYGARGGERWSTRRMVAPNGKRKKQVRWSRPLKTWRVSYDTKTQSQFDEIRNFLINRKNSGREFALKDWFDYKANMVEGGNLPLIHTVTTTPLPDTQIVKHYTDTGGFSYSKNIILPKAGTVTLYNNGSEIADSNYTLTTATDGQGNSYLTGNIEWDSGYAPGISDEITADYEFYYMVELLDDGIDFEYITFETFEMLTVTVAEVDNT